MDVNKCILIGRLVSDAAIGNTPGGVAYADFRIAVNRKYKSKDAEKPETDFFNIRAWRQSAEYAGKYFKKGKLVYICGSMENFTWEKDDKKCYGTRINAEEISLLEWTKQEDENVKPAQDVQQTQSSGGFIPMGDFVTADGKFKDDLPF